MFKVTVLMLDGTEKHIQVSPVERDGLKFAPPLTLNPSWGKVTYLGKPHDQPAVYNQTEAAAA